MNPFLLICFSDLCVADVYLAYVIFASVALRLLIVMSSAETEKTSTNSVENANESRVTDHISADESSDVENEVDLSEWKLVDEEYVCLDLIGLIKNTCLKECSKNDVKLVGMFDKEPVLQIGTSFFVGERQEVPGTNVLFQVESTSESALSDEEEDLSSSEKLPPVKLNLNCSTRKKLVMHQAFLSKKKETKENT